MSYAVETAPPARDRSIARCASRQAKASREKRIIDCLNRGVSVVEIAERENVSEKRMRALVRDVLARRMPEPPAQFLAMQVNRLNEALRLSFGAMSGANLQAVDRVVRIVRELDRYHGFVAAERWGLPDVTPFPIGEADEQVIAQLVKRLRETPALPETIESAPGNGVAPETPRPLDPAPQRDGALASAFDPAGAPPAGSRIASQGFERWIPGSEIVWPRKPRTHKIW
jgi:DNA-binding CsgD family transcriptional regulator